MAVDAATPPGGPSDGPRPPRRPRYRGTHPRAFHERYKELAPDRYPDIRAHVRARGATPAGTHVPILVGPAIEALRPAPGNCVLDATLGYGAHAEAFARCIGPQGRLVALDVDGATLDRTTARLAALGIVIEAHHRPFSEAANLARVHAPGGFDVVFADLGLSSMQIDDPTRGFSYKHDGPLDMRMDRGAPTTAADLLAQLSEQQLAAGLRELADEPDAARIAAAIVRARRERPLLRTRQLVDVVLAATARASRTSDPARAEAPAGRTGQHPALARSFQALRMLVNDEGARLDAFLAALPLILKPGGRVGVLAFHSGEDRRVKHAFRGGLRAGLYAAVAPDPVRPSADEIRDNPRAAPAKFRWARRAAGAPAAPAGAAGNA